LFIDRAGGSNFGGRLDPLDLGRLFDTNSVVVINDL
jgi:hypothetical protein